MRVKFLDKNLKWVIFFLFLFLVFYLFPNLISPAAFPLINPIDYIKISDTSITFSKNDISGDEVFYITASGKAIWTRNFPLFALMTFMVREAKATFSIEAQNQNTGDKVVLNSAYAVQIKSFPKKRGEYFQIEEKIPLQFPEKSEPGDYQVSWKVIEVKVKVLFYGWSDAKSFLPQLMNMGVVKYAD